MKNGQRLKIFYFFHNRIEQTTRILCLLQQYQLKKEIFHLHCTSFLILLKEYVRGLDLRKITRERRIGTGGFFFHLNLIQCPHNICILRCDAQQTDGDVWRKCVPKHCWK